MNGTVEAGTHPDVLDLEVVEDERIAVSPGTKADGGEVLVEADRLRPRRLAVRESKDLQHERSAIALPEAIMRSGSHLVLEADGARPAAHDKRVVRSDDRDDVDALRLELVVLLEVRREVVHVAGGLRCVSAIAGRCGWGYSL